MAGAVRAPPEYLRIPMPQGLLITISSLRSPSMSPVQPNRLSAVLRSHPPKRVPLAAIMGAVSVEPDSLSIPSPHGLETGISLLPSPSKSPYRRAIQGYLRPNDLWQTRVSDQARCSVTGRCDL